MTKSIILRDVCCGQPPLVTNHEHGEARKGRRFHAWCLARLWNWKGVYYLY